MELLHQIILLKYLVICVIIKNFLNPKLDPSIEILQNRKVIALLYILPVSVFSFFENVARLGIVIF